MPRANNPTTLVCLNLPDPSRPRRPVSVLLYLYLYHTWIPVLRLYVKSFEIVSTLRCLSQCYSWDTFLLSRPCTGRDTKLTPKLAFVQVISWLHDTASRYLQNAYRQQYTVGRFDAAVCALFHIQEVPRSNSCIEVTFLSDGFRSFAQSLRKNAAIVLRRVTSIGYCLPGISQSNFNRLLPARHFPE
jgi:hypothetical protein